MRQILARLWEDDRGALIATEWLMMATVPVMGLAAGMVSVRDSVNQEFFEFGRSVGVLDQGMRIPGLSGGGGAVPGVQVIDGGGPRPVPAHAGGPVAVAPSPSF